MSKKCPHFSISSSAFTECDKCKKLVIIILAEQRERISTLEKELKDMDNLCKQQSQNLDAEYEKNELLEKAAEAAEIVFLNEMIVNYEPLGEALRAAGYLG